MLTEMTNTARRPYSSGPACFSSRSRAHATTPLASKNVAPSISVTRRWAIRVASSPVSVGAESASTDDENSLDGVAVAVGDTSPPVGPASASAWLEGRNPASETNKASRYLKNSRSLTSSMSTPLCVRTRTLSSLACLACFGKLNEFVGTSHTRLLSHRCTFAPYTPSHALTSTPLRGICRRMPAPVPVTPNPPRVERAPIRSLHLERVATQTRELPTSPAGTVRRVE
jgi:hypothetical protein